jgi:hypothetical protein
LFCPKTGFCPLFVPYYKNLAILRFISSTYLSSFLNIDPFDQLLVYQLTAKLPRIYLLLF